MSQLSKNDLKAENQLQFPNNNNGAITPANLRAFNVDMIDSTVNQTQFDGFSGSVASEIDTLQAEVVALENFSASLSGGYVTEGELAAATASLIASINTKLDTTTFNAYTQSTDTAIAELESWSSSLDVSAITGSSLQTASFAAGTLTFTKGDGSTFGVIIPDVSGSTIDTGSFATTGSNTFVGIQNFTSEITASHTLISGDLTVNPTTATKLNGNTDIGAFLYINGGLTMNTPAEIRWVGVSGSIDSNFSASVDARINAITGGTAIDTGSFATTGSNTFTGDQTLIDSEGNSVTLTDASGSLMLVAKGFTSASAHLTGNPNQVNLIFKNTNDTVATVLSGSANLLSNAIGTLAGLRREISGIGNIALQGANIPYISASMAFPIVASGNIYNAPVIARGPVSASLWTITNNLFNNQLVIGAPPAANHARGFDNTFFFSSNVILAQSTIVANGSSIKGLTFFAGNIINGPTINIRQSGINANNNNLGASTINNDYFSGSAGFGFISLSGNLIQGINTINFTGSLDAGIAAQPAFNTSILYGFSNIVGLNATGAGALHSVVGSGIIGGNLIVTGSSAAATAATVGSMFVGRFNSVDGNKARTAQTVFAVGTGTAAATRKTGFLIDSGSNTFVEGTLNVSGSTSMTGSLTIQSGSGDLFMYGHKMFSVGGFQSNITQSGSADVSQSVSYDVTDVSQGVSLVSGSQLTVGNAGFYSITFSAQLLADTGADTVWMWLKKNGNNVAESASKKYLSNNEAIILTVNYLVEADANDYFEIAWQNDQGDAVLFAEAAAGNIPAIPSVIVTVIQVR